MATNLRGDALRRQTLQRFSSSRIDQFGDVAIFAFGPIIEVEVGYRAAASLLGHAPDGLRAIIGGSRDG